MGYAEWRGKNSLVRQLRRGGGDACGSTIRAVRWTAIAIARDVRRVGTRVMTHVWRCVLDICLSI